MPTVPAGFLDAHGMAVARLDLLDGVVKAEGAAHCIESLEELTCKQVFATRHHATASEGNVSISKAFRTSRTSLKVKG